MTCHKKNDQFAPSRGFEASSNDITDQILAESYDPHYQPLAPSYEELAEYSDDLEHWGNQITYEWATEEILSSRMGWVRAGLVADRVRRYRLYQGKFSDWRTYCKEVLGKQNWQVNKMIDAAKALMELTEHGFKILPNCTSQMEKLISCCKKGQMLLTEAWQEVIDYLPAAHLITATRICEILGFPIESGYNLPKGYLKKIRHLAERDGVSIGEKLDELIYLDTEPEEEESYEETEAEQFTKEQLWHQDMRKLVEQHDREIWLLSVIAKLVKPIKKTFSQYSYLKQLKYQT
ncbi:hypothetical protein [Pleurocapsa sp. FMAR1]|uniref:hypothetical protein n=1 Tax=Pleurocapsa sp. FMAR1 TaxID=3040204 RepID=UPI0029C71EC3|nr:hypothetical protein [Pleurocapsa sp. FMAR1]